MVPVQGADSVFSACNLQASEARILLTSQNIAVDSQNGTSKRFLKTHLPVLGLITVGVSVLVIFGFVDRSHFSKPSFPGPYPRTEIPPSSEPQKTFNFNWTQLPELTEGLQNQDFALLHNGNVTVYIDQYTLRINATPKFCNDNVDSRVPLHLTLTIISRLHLSGMEDCPWFIDRVLGGWEFGEVAYLQTHRGKLMGRSFIALMEFLKKHTGTLNEVKIINSEMSPSSRAHLRKLARNNFRLVLIRQKAFLVTELNQ